MLMPSGIHMIRVNPAQKKLKLWKAGSNKQNIVQTNLLLAQKSPVLHDKHLQNSQNKKVPVNGNKKNQCIQLKESREAAEVAK